MFEAIDLVLGPLFRVNPIRYLRDPAYRQQLRSAGGRRTGYRLAYALLFVLGVMALLALVILAALDI
ncbi:hypothetical protein KQ945_05445 [Bacillus subtilis subsp. subtilis]|nr:hypothetical protein [Bacillus subtilis subsp. subtilis]